MSSVDVVITSFGDNAVWAPLRRRAGDSVEAQTIWGQEGFGYFSGHHDGTLAEARNYFAERSEADWLIFLDADDELDPYYVEAMLKVSPGMHPRSPQMRWPSTIGVYEDGTTDDYPVLMQPRGSLIVHNWMVIGTMVPRLMFLEVGGFRDLPILEDWDLWIRLVLAGCIPTPCEAALYRVHVLPNSRNNPDIHGYTYTEIQRRYQQEWYSKGLS